MPATCLSLNEEETRRCKLYHLVVDGGGGVLRFLFDKSIPNPCTYLNNTKVRLEFKQLQTKNIISKAQYELLYPTTGTSSSKDYDITLLVALHRVLLCTKKGHDPIWRSGNKPASNDFTVEAELVRLRDFRNELLHVPKVGGLSEAQFDAKWNDICQVLLRFGAGMPGLKDKLDPSKNDLKTDCLDKPFEQELLLKLKEWNEMDKAFGDEIMRTIQSNSPSDIALERSKRELSDVLDDSYFVKTNVFQKAKDILNDKGIIVIKGAQGEGKTTMGKKLVKDPDKCLKINKCSDWDIRNNSKIDTVLIDDMFGCTMFDKGDSRKWLKYITQIKDDVQNKRLKVIITSRSYILDEVLEKMYVSHLINETNTLTISSKDLTDNEKRDILQKHIQMNDRTLNESLIKECTDEANKPSSFVIGFPECARLFCQHDDFFKKKSAFFKSPMAHIKQCLVDIFKNEQVFLAFFVLWAQKSQELTLLNLEQAVVDTPKSILETIEKLQFRPDDMLRTIRDSLQRLTDFIRFDTSMTFSFSHRVLSDAVGLVAYEKNGTAVLQYCDSSFIERFVRIEDDTRDRNQADISDDGTSEVGIIIPPLRFEQLCSRIGEIMEDMNITQQQRETGTTTYSLDDQRSSEGGQLPTRYLKCLPLLHPAFHNTQFCEMFIKDVMKGKTVTLLTTPVSTVRADLVGFEKVLDKNVNKQEICLLAFSLKNSMTQFASVCYKEMKRIGCKTDEVSSSVTKVLKADLLISLILAVARGDQRMIEYLAELGAPVGDQNVIFTAFKKANSDIMTYLLDIAGKRVCSYRKNGKSPLILFVEENNTEAVKSLLSSKHFSEDEINFQSGTCSETALHKACQSGQDEIVEQLLLAKPKLFLRDVNGYCPIHVAAMAGHVKIVQRLLEHDKTQADLAVNLSDNMKHVKLFHIAVFKEDADVIELLERLGISPCCMDDNKKQSPLMFALQQQKCRIVRKLTGMSIAHKAHFIADHRGNTALHIAVEKLPDLDPNESEIYREVISLLCKNDVNANLANLQGKSALQLAEGSNLHDVRSELEKYNVSSSSLSQETDTDKKETSESDYVSPAKRAKHI